jgi:hypothetical protein
MDTFKEKEKIVDLRENSEEKFNLIKKSYSLLS